MITTKEAIFAWELKSRANVVRCILFGCVQPELKRSRHAHVPSRSHCSSRVCDSLQRLDTARTATTQLRPHSPYRTGRTPSSGKFDAADRVDGGKLPGRSTSSVESKMRWLCLPTIITCVSIPVLLWPFTTSSANIVAICTSTTPERTTPNSS